MKAWDMGESSLLDCAVIGAGPAGLTAAIYLRRFHRDIVVLDAGESRARWIPESHNCPGFPQGVSGNAFLQRMREQAGLYDVSITQARITGLTRIQAGFRITDEAGHAWTTSNVIMATGVLDLVPGEPWVEDAVKAGAMRLCAICDGYEVSDGRIGVYGPIRTALKHALFLRTFSEWVVVVANDGDEPSERERASASAAGVDILPGPVSLGFDGLRCEVVDAAGGAHRFDALYPVLGSEAQSGLARTLGARTDENDELIIARDQQTSIAGLYAVGDVVSALNQISVATGHAAIAATAIHNKLPPNYR